MVRDSLSEPDSDNKGAVGAYSPTSPYPYMEVFCKKFPYYLSIGMTERQYWEQDCTLVKYYRDAEKLRMERKNQEMWLQGMYIYDAISRLSPILHAFAKKGTKPKPYPNEPYPIGKTDEQGKKEVQEKKDKAQEQKGLMYMQTYMTQFNKKFGEKKE